MFRNTVFVAMCLLSTSVGLAQPDIPMEKISTTIVKDVRSDIIQLYSRTPQERAYAAYHLGALGGRAEAALPYLRGLLKERDLLEWTQDGKLELLGAKGGLIAIAYDDILSTNRKFTFTGEEAAKAMARISRRGMDLLIDALKTKGNEAAVYDNAMVPFERTKDLRLPPILIEFLNGQNGGELTQAKAAWMLGMYREEGAIEPLINALKSDLSIVRETSAKALGNITGKNFGEDVDKWRAWYKTR
jgi:HEAT repeat protein